MDRMAYYDEKQLVEIDYSRISSKSKPQQTEKVKEMMSSIRVPAFQKQSVKRFLDFLKDTQSSDASIPAALREAIYTLESKVEKHSDSSAMDSYIEGIKKDIEILKKLEDLLPRL
jgi:RAB protein geranylgeranyltransferase component A